MKKATSALALAALLAAPGIHASQVEFGGDLQVTGFTANGEGFAAAGQDDWDDYGGFQQLLRLSANFQNEDGVQVVTRMNLANNTWSGHEGTGNVDDNQVASQSNNQVSLDLGYVQIPLANGLLRVGRQETSWAHCLVACDERRDRILYSTRVGGFQVNAFYDKASIEDVNVDGDQDNYQLAVIGMLPGNLLGGLLFIHSRYGDDFANPALAGEDVNTITPYIDGNVGGVDLKAAFVFQTFSSDFIDDDRMAAFVRAGYDLGVANIEGQVYWADQYSANSGFDSFSSLINNSPRGNVNPVSFASLDPLGDEVVGFAARVSTEVADGFRLVAAAGLYDFDALDDDVTFFDLQAHYQLTPSTSTWATFGWADDGDEDVIGATLNVRTTF
ncbi:hypothetical protein CAI21_02140 [Alkalilimnicola ehrlichii]|uniref:Porin domain-containing protein n=1 Tax=Alkalilimnicola ehrlichii TaxID=351052 RepID=A0A3E0X0W4_9GAMM|nr:hypothetical protein [Alkalilimnicola ehrlichii]RFA31435.1 hypothetical protein CAI21_02140 [Alkalilimnicola ehrlichii]RFA39293.1 hypothetical protein CAL65_00250 [Alkalilimnicola ehrlichii]